MKGADVMDQPQLISAADVDGNPHESFLGELDITSDRISLTGLDREIETFADGALLRAILDGGADAQDGIREYESRLSAVEVDAITDYVREADNLVALQDDIIACDDTLAAIQEILGRYAADLATTAAEIRILRERSRLMNAELEMKRDLSDGLSDFISRLVLLPSVIKGIMESPAASDQFTVALEQLTVKLEMVAADEDVRQSAAFRDVAPELQRLRMAAVGKCRKLLIEQIYALRQSRIHVQAKQAEMMRHAAAAAFLRRQGGDIYGEVRAAYAERVGGKFLDIFRSYWSAMERVEKIIIGPEALLGAPEAGPSAASVAGVLSMLSLGSSSGASVSLTGPPSAPGRAEVFALGDRASAVFDGIDAPPLVLHMAETEHRKFPFEVLFRSISKLLMDTGAHEYLFCTEFWGDDGSGAYRATFDPVAAFVRASLAAAISENHDPLTLLLCIRVNREHSLILARRAIPALDDHFDAVNLLLWPRLKTVLDAQLSSLESVPLDASTTGDVSPTRVHPITARYAALTAAVLALHSDFLDGPLETNIERMRYTVMNMLLTLSRGFPQRGRGSVFLIHNFSYVVSALKEAASRPVLPPSSLLSSSAAGVSVDASPGLGAAGQAAVTAFEEALSKATELYIDARLTAGAPQLIAFVRKGEAAIARSQVEQGAIIPGFSPCEAAPIARDFSARWERVVDVLNREIQQDFGMTAAGRTVQQAAFTQLLLLWSRFLELLNRQGDAGAEVTKAAVSMPSIMYALKQHR